MHGDYRIQSPAHSPKTAPITARDSGDSPVPGWGDTQARGARGAVPEATAAAQPPAKMGILTISTNPHVRRSCLPTGHDGSVLSATSLFQHSQMRLFSVTLYLGWKLNFTIFRTIPVSHAHFSGLDPAHKQREQYLQRFSH